MMSRRVTLRAMATISRTLKPLPLPRLQINVSWAFKPCKASKCAAERPLRSRVRSARYLVITPQAMRSPALPAGSVFMSSALA